MAEVCLVWYNKYFGLVVIRWGCLCNVLCSFENLVSMEASVHQKGRNGKVWTLLLATACCSSIVTGIKEMSSAAGSPWVLVLSEGGHGFLLECLLPSLMISLGFMLPQPILSRSLWLVLYLLSVRTWHFQISDWAARCLWHGVLVDHLGLEHGWCLLAFVFIHPQGWQ